MSGATPKQIIEIKELKGKKEFFCNYEFLNEILLDPDVKDRKIVAVSITGALRQGKSFLMGYSLRYLRAKYRSTLRKCKSSSNSHWIGSPNEPLQGFTWQHGRKANTKGILFWSEVFLHDLENGEKIAIIIVDTQGLFETKKASDENVKISGLSSLISSIQILNIKEVMDERIIEYLETATSVTKIIADTGNKGKKPFQKLIFLFRDWSDDEIGYGYEGGEKYMKEFLSTTDISDGKAKDIRENIPASYEEIKSFLLQFPGEIVKKSDFKGEWGKLNDDFREGMKSFIESVFDHQNLSRNKKSILGRDVTGAELHKAIKIYVQAYQESSLPEPQNIFEMMINNHMKAVLAHLLGLYQENMNEHIDFDQENFKDIMEKKHKETKAMTIEKFLKADKFEIGDKIMEYVQSLEDVIEKTYSLWRDHVMKRHEEYVKNKDLTAENQAQQKEIEENNARKQWLNFAGVAVKAVGDTATTLGRAYITSRGFSAAGNLLLKLL